MKKILFTITLMCILIFGTATLASADQYSSVFLTRGFSGRLVPMYMDSYQDYFFNTETQNSVKFTSYIQTYQDISYFAGKTLIWGFAFDSAYASQLGLSTSSAMTISYAGVNYTVNPAHNYQVKFDAPAVTYTVLVYRYNIPTNWVGDLISFTVPTNGSPNYGGTYHNLLYDLCFVNVIDSKDVNFYLQQILATLQQNQVQSTNPAQQEEFDNAQDQAKQAFEDSNNYDKPDVVELNDVIAVDNYVDSSSMALVGSTLGILFDEDGIIFKILLIVGGLALVSYVFFGKK